MQLPLNVSPVSASFFGPLRLGIHLGRCLACSHSLARSSRDMGVVIICQWFSSVFLLDCACASLTRAMHTQQN